VSVFDGLTGVLDATFGAPVTITPKAGAPATVIGQFRENAREVLDPSGNVQVIDTPTLQVRRPLPAAVAVGARVEPSTRPGEVWRIRGIHRDRSPAADAYAVIELEVPRR
jgi:hypothetical protein